MLRSIPARLGVSALIVVLNAFALPAPAFAANVVRILVGPSGESMAVGDTRNYHATAIFDDATSADITSLVTWDSTAPGVATIGSTGIVTGMSVGDTTITATYSGFSSSVVTRVRGVDAYLYAAGWGNPEGLRGFHIDLITGQSTGSLPVGPSGVSPWGVAADPSGRFVYVANRNSNTVTGFAISAADGQLTSLGTYPTGGSGPTNLIVERTGRFLYIGNLNGNSIAAYAINGDGTLAAVPGSPFAVPGVLALASDPDGEYLYFSTAFDHRLGVAHIGVNGELTAVAGSPFWFDNFASASFLHGITVDRSGRYLLATDNWTNSVRAFGIDRATGALTGETSRVYDLNVSKDIIAHPDGRHIIAAGQGTIHVFTLDANTGTLTAVAGSPFTSDLAPQVLALDHSGTRLYGVNGDQGGATTEGLISLSLHYFNPATGAVTRFAKQSTTASLFGLAIVGSNGPAPDLTQIDVTPAATTLQTTIFGITQVFSATGTYSDGRSGPLSGISWSSSDPSIVSIDASKGVGTINGYGTATITAARNGVTGQATITVSPAPMTALYIGPAAVLTTPGSTTQLHAIGLFSDAMTRDVSASASWSSSVPAVATVAGGFATASASGTTSIGATLNGFTATATLTVKSGNAVVYAVDRSQGRLYAYQRAGAGGALSAVAGSPFTTSGASFEGVAITPDGRFAFVADNANDRLYAFQVDGASSELVAAPGSPFKTRPNPADAYVDPLGRFVYVVTRSDKHLSAFVIDQATGQLTPTTVDQPVFLNPIAMAFDPGGRFLYVSNGQGGVDDQIRIFSVDQVTGALTTIGNVPTGRFPAALVTDPAGRFLYVANGSENTVSRFAINPATGGLTFAGNTVTGAGPRRLAFHPGGGVIYVGINSNSAITSYAVDPVSGALTAMNSAPVFGALSGIAVDASGSYLYVANELLTTFAIDAAGALTKIQDYSAGNSPADVSVAMTAPAGVAPVSLAVAPPTATIFGSGAGGTRQFAAVGTYADGSQSFLSNSATWSSSNPGAVTVSSTGLATVVTMPGTATITAAFEGQAGTASFIATNLPARLVVAPIIETMSIGAVRSLRAFAIYGDNSAEDVTAQTTWISSNSIVASVDAAGSVSARAEGDATINASYLGVDGAALVRVRSIDANLFVSNWTAPGLRAYHADVLSSQLSAINSGDTGLSPMGVATDPTGRWAYVANRSDNTVSAFAIDASTGALMALGTYPTGGESPGPALVDPSGRFLYVGNEIGNSIAAFSINGDGTLTAVSGSPITVPGVRAMAAHPSGEYLYFSTGQDHRIAAMRITATGALVSVGGPFWFDDFGQFNNLLGLAVDRSGRYLLASDNSTHSIFVFGIDVATGALTGQASRVINLTLSKTIVAHPDGVHVIAMGQGNIYVFTFDATTGELTPVPNSPFASSFAPWVFALDHSGTRIYAINGEQGAVDINSFSTVSIHAFDPLTGAAPRIATRNIGGTLMGLTLTPGAPPDLVAPPAPIITQHPENPSRPSTSAFSFAFTDIEAGVSFECALDGGVLAPCSSPATFVALTAGPHTFTVRAVDAAGNRSAITTFSWTLDARYPTSFTVSPSQTIVFGTPSFNVSGVLTSSSGVSPAAGEQVAIVVNGELVIAAIDESGAFAATVPTPSLLSGRTYSINYQYQGSPDLLPAQHRTTSVTVNPAAAAITVTGYSGVFDGQFHGASGTATGAFGEDLSALLHLGPSFIDVPGGVAHWTFDGNQNYPPASGDVVITITPATAAITVNGYTGVYDGIAHGATGTATGVLGENLNAFLNLGQSFTNPPGGTAQWTFNAPNYKTASGSVAIVLTAPPNPGSLDGRMRGAGHIVSGGEHHHAALQIQKQQSKIQGRLAYWITDRRDCSDEDDHERRGNANGDDDRDYGRGKRTLRRFESTSIDAAAFSNDPAGSPGKAPKNVIADAVTFSGRGMWNGKAGYTFEATAIDRGEPGRGRDALSIVIKDSRGVIVASVSGVLTEGNLQALPAR